MLDISNKATSQNTYVFSISKMLSSKEVLLIPTVQSNYLIILTAIWHNKRKMDGDYLASFHVKYRCKVYEDINGYLLHEMSLPDTLRSTKLRRNR